MSQLIESIESRILFTGSAFAIEHDLAVLKAEVTASNADLTAALKAATADVKTIKADVVAAKPTSAQKAAFSTFQKDELSDAAKYRQTIAKILTTGTRDGLHLQSVLISLKATPDQHDHPGECSEGADRAARRLLRQRSDNCGKQRHCHREQSRSRSEWGRRRRSVLTERRERG